MGHGEAIELGEALIDAGFMTYDSGMKHEIEFVGDTVVAVPANMAAVRQPDDPQVDFVVVT